MLGGGRRRWEVAEGEAGFAEAAVEVVGEGHQSGALAVGFVGEEVELMAFVGDDAIEEDAGTFVEVAWAEDGAEEEAYGAEDGGGVGGGAVEVGGGLVAVLEEIGAVGVGGEEDGYGGAEAVLLAEGGATLVGEGGESGFEAFGGGGHFSEGAALHDGFAAWVLAEGDGGDAAEFEVGA